MKKVHEIRLEIDQKHYFPKITPLLLGRMDRVSCLLPGIGSPQKGLCIVSILNILRCHTGRRRFILSGTEEDNFLLFGKI
jgi:hypothetical protein